MQYTVHGKEVYFVPPQDAALLLEDRISPRLRKSLKQHNAVEGVGRLANHTCCDIHWNANLEVASIEQYEETDIEPMGILRARHDIEQDTEILTRYWHKKKDAWQNIFKCECCACPPLFLTSSVNGLITLLYYFAIFLCLQSILKILFCLKTDIGFQKNVRSRVLKREWVGDWSFLVTAFHTVDGCVVVVYGCFVWLYLSMFVYREKNF